MQNVKWREAMAAVGVILSLLLVAYEVRQNTEAVRGETLQGIAEMSLQVGLAGFSDPEFQAVYQRTSSDLQSLTPLEAQRFNWFYAASLRVMENRYRQIKLGLLPDDATVLGGGAGTYQHPYFREYWGFSRDQYPLDFQEFIDLSVLPRGLPTS